MLKKYVITMIQTSKGEPVVAPMMDLSIIKPKLKDGKLLSETEDCFAWDCEDRDI